MVCSDTRGVATRRGHHATPSYGFCATRWLRDGSPSPLSCARRSIDSAQPRDCMQLPSAPCSAVHAARSMELSGISPAACIRAQTQTWGALGARRILRDTSAIVACVARRSIWMLDAAPCSEVHGTGGRRRRCMQLPGCLQRGGGRSPHSHQTKSHRVRSTPDQKALLM